ncbi:MAG: SDR family NAD(P)-dependent oxidoreductase [Ardenticatenaceae bacterium]|nr:SDR family NAD(P)-dependent oxidoreductase [Ardenticatenaceae bacterium]
MNGQPVALVTGASTGIGKKIAETLVKQGYVTYGTSRRQRPDGHGIRMRVLEVTDGSSVKSCVDGILAETGRIDLLVNNAAVVMISPGEELPLEKAEEMMQINFFGAVRVINAVLPQMRRQRSGRLIFISSLAGLMGVPGQGFYCSTKHAMEGYADALHMELAKFNIRVSLVEPGSFRTEIIEKSDDLSWPTIPDYDGMRERLSEVIKERTKAGNNPQRVADVVARAAASKRPRLRYRVAAEGKQAVFLKSLLPEKFFYSTVSKMFGLK